MPTPGGPSARCSSRASASRRSSGRPAAGHVYTLHAELEGGKLAPAFDAMLAGWKSQGYDLVSMRALAESLDLRSLPRNEIAFGSVAGRSGLLALQGREFLS